MTNTKTKRPPGRPALGQAGAINRVVIRVDSATLARWTGTAKVLGMSLSAWIRRRCGQDTHE